MCVGHVHTSNTDSKKKIIKKNIYIYIFIYWCFSLLVAELPTDLKENGTAEQKENRAKRKATDDVPQMLR